MTCVYGSRGSIELRHTIRCHDVGWILSVTLYELLPLLEVKNRKVRS